MAKAPLKATLQTVGKADADETSLADHGRPELEHDFIATDYDC